ncbi:MAG TPA: sodium-dependent transporter [Kiritimatiellae bacterium]|nr:sodium-dependent transporter [Kiritimatiellia bacterium]
MAAGARALWGSKIGFLLAAIGSAIGLGNIWRFSYMAYEHGGGAFLVPYAVALLVAGIPLMILEYGLGHREQASSPLAFARVRVGWEWIGWAMPIMALFGIMLYYAVVIGWCINYLFYAVNQSWGGDPEGFFFKQFLQVSDSPFHLGGIRVPIASATFFVWFLCWVICFREVNHGIEKACLIFMPLLFVLTLVLVGWTVSLPGAAQSIRNVYLKPDWHKINLFTNPEARQVWIAAFGQIFFTLSLGFGIMITYASYLPRKADIVGNALWTSLVNCLYSFVAGFAVFGIVGFMAQAKGVGPAEVIRGGPGLAFVVYPAALQQLPFGSRLFGFLFFLVLIIAGLSSGISLIEAFTCSLTDKFEWSRKATVSWICLLGFLGSLIFTTRAGLLVLDIADHFITNYGLVTGGILECLLVGWVLKARLLRRHVGASGGMRLPALWDILVKFITPAVLAVLVVNALLRELARAYGGYHVDAVILFGVDWLLVCVAVAVAFTFSAWKPEKLVRVHRPEEEHLLT